MLNLTKVFIRWCKRFYQDIDEKKQIPVDPTAAAVSDVDLPTLREEADKLMAKMLSILSEPLLPENL